MQAAVLRGGAACAGLGALVPVAYLVLRALEGGEGLVQLLQPRHLTLLGNTLALVGTVLVADTALALPAAWLLGRSELARRRGLVALVAAPVVIPGYIVALALLGLGGDYGLLARLVGWRLPRPQGLWGATLCLTLYTYPYVFLSARAALLGLDPSLEEAARSLGLSPWGVARRVVLPQLLPALRAAWLVVGLYVLGDFGAVSLLRYETYSYAVYLRYAGALDRTGAAALSLPLLGLAALGWAASRAGGGRGVGYRAGSGASRPAPRARLGWARPLALGYLALLVGLGVGLPLGTLFLWLLQDPQAVGGRALAHGLGGTAVAAGGAALLALALAFPLAHRATRGHGWGTAVLVSLPHLGHALPPFVVGLGWAFLGLRALPFLYGRLVLLLLALALYFVPLAFGPLRAAWAQLSPRLEEAARSLGHGPLGAAVRSALPGLVRGAVAGGALVFLRAATELPLTFLLSPLGFSTLATRTFAAASEALFAQAAPFALALLALALPSLVLLLRMERET